MSKLKPVSPVPRPLFKSVILGSLAGLLAGLTMLCAMGILRLFFGWPTPIELIFDRVFPLLTVNFFISSLVKEGGYTPLKLQGVYGALAGNLAVASVGGVIYSLYLRRKNREAVVRTPSPRSAWLVAHHSRRPWGYGTLCGIALAHTDYQLSRASAADSPSHRRTRNANLV